MNYSGNPSWRLTPIVPKIQSRSFLEFPYFLVRIKNGMEPYEDETGPGHPGTERSIQFPGKSVRARKRTGRRQVKAERLNLYQLTCD